jgi:hypothetical protein
LSLFISQVCLHLKFVYVKLSPFFLHNTAINTAF